MRNRPRVFGRAFSCGLALLCGLALAGHARAAETINAAVSPAAEASRVFCDATGAAPQIKRPCVIRSLYVTTGATAGYLMTFNAVAAPANGAVTPRECVVAPANSTVGIDFGETAEPYVTGLSAVFSSTGCFTQTTSATAFFKGRMQ